MAVLSQVLRHGTSEGSECGLQELGWVFGHFLTLSDVFLIILLWGSGFEKALGRVRGTWGSSSEMRILHMVP